MNDSPQTESFSEFWGICFFYMVSWGLVTSTLGFIVGVVGLTMFSAATNQWPHLKARVARFAAIVAIQFTASMLQLQVIWLFFAATVWAISFIVYRIIKQKMIPFLRLDHPFPVSQEIPLIPS